MNAARYLISYNKRRKERIADPISVKEVGFLLEENLVTSNVSLQTK